MTVALRSGGRANEKDVLFLEEIIGQPLSHEFRKFLSSFDGAKPEINVFTVNAQIESGVNRFIPVDQIPLERNNIENIPDEGYPIAWAEGGNYIILDEGRQGAILFWDHEIPGEEHKIANSFGAFLDQLHPFKPSSVRLAPGQVKSAWVNPDLLRRVRK